MKALEKIREKKGTVRAAVYARFSSDNQRDESIDAQLRAINEYAKRNDILVVSEYIDRAKSAMTDNRPEFLTMIKDAKKDLFDVVIVHKLDRFARNRSDSIGYRTELKRYGISLISVLEYLDDESPESIILESVLEAMAEYYSKNLAREVRKGMNENALKGLHTGGSGALGYNVDPNTRKYIINEWEAEAVRIIFQMYIEGSGYNVIADALNAQGYKTKMNKPFGKGSISSILRNERYTGVYIFNRLSSKDIDGKRNNHLYKDESEMVRIEGGMPQIISKEDYQLAQRKMESRRRVRACNNAKEVYLLSRKVFCGECGRVYTGNRKNSGRKKTLHVTYACTGRKSRNGCTNTEIRREYLETFVMEKLADYLFDETLIPKICEAYGDYQLSKNAGHLKTKENYEKRKKEVTKSIDNIVEMIMQSPSTVLAEKLSELEQEKERLNDSYKEICKNADIQNLDEEEITQMFKVARNQLEVGTLKMTKILVETFIDKVLVYKDRIEIVFNFCKDISKTQEVEDIVNFNRLREGCDKKQEYIHRQSPDAILCVGGSTPVASTTISAQMEVPVKGVASIFFARKPKETMGWHCGILEWGQHSSVPFLSDNNKGGLKC